jgi:flagellar basal body rod protein FlgC
MQLGNVMAIASGGMRVETDRLAESAARVARATTPGDAYDRVSLGSEQPAATSGYDRSGAAARPTGDVDLASERVAQVTSLRAFQANLSVLRTADEMLGSLVTQRA